MTASVRDWYEHVPEVLWKKETCCCYKCCLGVCSNKSGKSLLLNRNRQILHLELNGVSALGWGRLVAQENLS